MGFLAYIVPMYVERVPNRNSRPAYLLRTAQRQGKRVVKKTLANLSDWPVEKIEMLRRVLAGEILVAPDSLFSVDRSTPHGHVEVVLAMIRKLGLDRLIAATRCRERDLVIGMIVERIIHPASKLDTLRLWKNSTLEQELQIEQVEIDELYAALDWLYERQNRIERNLAKRHLHENSKVYYDVSSSYYYGRHCRLVHFGHNRDGKHALPILVYGLMTDDEGRPLAVEVYPGNTADPKTVADQVSKLRDRFGLERVVLIGDRGMLTDTQIETLRTYPGLGWISCLRSSQIRTLVEQQDLQLSLFDQTDLAELTVEGSDERLIACFNPLLAEERARKRQALLEATEQDLTRIQRDVARRTRKPLSDHQIGQRVGRVLYRRKMGKHFQITIENSSLRWTRRDDAIAREAALDGIYVVRTSEPAERLSAEDAVRQYKDLSRVERAFRCLKSDLRIRPVYHRAEPRVRAHVLLCMLAYYVEWHLRRALESLLYHDEELEQVRLGRHPVRPARASSSGQRKKITRQSSDGLPLHSFSSLIDHLSARARVTLRFNGDPSAPPVTQISSADPIQQRVLDLIRVFPVA